MDNDIKKLKLLLDEYYLLMIRLLNMGAHIEEYISGNEKNIPSWAYKALKEFRELSDRLEDAMREATD
jgi:hypothetical protein